MFESCRVRQCFQIVSIASMGGFGAQDSTKVAATQPFEATSAFVEARFPPPPADFMPALEDAPSACLQPGPG